jgi:hypothetical protein
MPFLSASQWTAQQNVLSCGTTGAQGITTKKDYLNVLLKIIIHMDKPQNIMNLIRLSFLEYIKWEL